MADVNTNPNLVAAAPAMLAVLEEIAVMVDGSGACILPGSPIMKRVKKALAEATARATGDCSDHGPEEHVAPMDLSRATASRESGGQS
jgi:hypothetical protein